MTKNQKSVGIFVIGPLGLVGALHTFIFNGHVSDDHEMSSALTCEVVLRALFQFPGVFVPRNDSIVEGHLAFEGGRLALVDFDVVDAFGEMNLFSYNRYRREWVNGFGTTKLGMTTQMVVFFHATSMWLEMTVRGKFMGWLRVTGC